MSNSNNLKPSKIITRVISFSPIALFFFGFFSLKNHAAETNFQFYAEAVVTLKRFNPHDVKPFVENVSGNVLFYYSNGWWRVEAKCYGSDGSRYVVDCKRIPEGIRRYILFEGVTNGLTTANVCPIAFPPPGNRASFLAWVSLCPSLDLPLISSRKMRRFLSVPFCESELLNHPKNEGDYRVKYLQGRSGFLEELNITNNGYSLEYEGYIGPYPSPFEDGFPEICYQVTESTNILGLEFPLRAVATFFAPLPTAKTRDDVYAASIYEIYVKNYAMSELPAPFVASPAVLIAIDKRPVGLPAERSIDYFVTNDSWKSSSDFYLKQKLVKMKANKNATGKNPSVARAVLLITFLLFPLLFVFIFRMFSVSEKST